jgi:PAS domain-containing protein
VAPAQNAIELILIRRWASYVNAPLFVAGAEGQLLYFNEAAATLLGRPFDTAGEMDVRDLDRIFTTTDGDGRPVPAADLPIHVALVSRLPRHRRFRIAALDGVSRLIDVTAIPIEGQGGRFLGVMAFFWEASDP